MEWLTVDDIIYLHSELISKTGGIDGLHDRTLVESAVTAPLQSFDSVDFYPTVLEKISRLGFGLASNHAFLDGNKRIGALVTQILLANNGYELLLRKGELSDMFIAIADDRASASDLLLFLTSHITRSDSDG